jgi:hypothetical protein
MIRQHPIGICVQPFYREYGRCEFGSKFYYAEYNDPEQIADLERKEYTGIQVM